jgi:hypothetical protein
MMRMRMRSESEGFSCGSTCVKRGSVGYDFIIPLSFSFR